MTKTKSRMQIDWQLAFFFSIAYTIAWPIAFFFGVDEELIRTNHSPPAANFIIYLPKFAFTISGVILFWLNGQNKEIWTRQCIRRVHLFWYALAYLGPAILYLPSAWISSEEPLSPRLVSSSLWMLTFAAQSGVFAYFLFRGGLGEEIGLRGFALSRLQIRHSHRFLEPFPLASIYRHEAHLRLGCRVCSYSAHNAAQQLLPW